MDWCKKLWIASEMRKLDQEQVDHHYQASVATLDSPTEISFMPLKKRDVVY